MELASGDREEACAADCFNGVGLVCHAALHGESEAFSRGTSLKEAFRLRASQVYPSVTAWLDISEALRSLALYEFFQSVRRARTSDALNDMVRRCCENEDLIRFLRFQARGCVPMFYALYNKGRRGKPPAFHLLWTPPLQKLQVYAQIGMSVVQTHQDESESSSELAMYLQAQREEQDGFRQAVQGLQAAGALQTSGDSSSDFIDSESE